MGMGNYMVLHSCITKSCNFTVCKYGTYRAASITLLWQDPVKGKS